MRHRHVTSARSPALVVAVLAFASVAACDRGSSVAHPTTPGSPPITPVSSTPSAGSTPVPPPPTPTSPPPTVGGTTSTCVNGWVTPPASSARWRLALRLIRETTGVPGPLVVVDMRYFTGPESPPSDLGYLAVVQRWYVKLYAQRDPAFAGRFLVEARRFGRGVSAVARYGSRGFHSPDWIGFQYDSGDTAQRAYPGLPGEWGGVPYDFVKGGRGLTFPGLPSQVAGCLDGT